MHSAIVILIFNIVHFNGEQPDWLQIIRIYFTMLYSLNPDENRDISLRYEEQIILQVRYYYKSKSTKRISNLPSQCISISGEYTGIGFVLRFILRNREVKFSIILPTVVQYITIWSRSRRNVL